MLKIANFRIAVRHTRVAAEISRQGAGSSGGGEGIEKGPIEIRADNRPGHQSRIHERNKKERRRNVRTRVTERVRPGNGTGNYTYPGVPAL